MKNGFRVAALLSAALSLLGCSSLPDAPPCKGKYERINPADRYAPDGASR